MKIMHLEEPWPHKVNFIDENEVHLGFDGTDECCAFGGWFLSEDKAARLEETYAAKSMELPGWTFDPSYFQESCRASDSETEESSVQFRLVNGDKEMFLTLFNIQNGYYSRGFDLDVKSDPSKNREGKL